MKFSIKHKKMKTQNKIIFGVALLFGILLSLNFATALGELNVTLNSPATNALVGGGPGVLLNITISNGGALYSDLVNVSVYAQSTLTANSTWALIQTNLSLNISTENETSVSFNSSILEDANNYIFNVTISNNTGGQVLAGDGDNTGITVDNTNPAAASALSPGDKAVDDDGSVTFSGTVTGTDTTSCTLEFVGTLPTGGNSQAMTHTGNTCSLTLSTSSQTYTWFIRASDETNTTDNTAIQVTVDVTTSSGKAALLISEGLAKSEGGSAFSVIGETGIFGENSTAIIVMISIVTLGFVFRKRLFK